MYIRIYIYISTNEQPQQHTNLNIYKYNIARIQDGNSKSPKLEYHKVQNPTRQQKPELKSTHPEVNITNVQA